MNAHPKAYQISEYLDLRSGKSMHRNYDVNRASIYEAMDIEISEDLWLTGPRVVSSGPSGGWRD
jgi:hypothetical protein